MIDFQCGGTSDGSMPFQGDRDLRRRLMARVGAPLTASVRNNEMSAKELVAEQVIHSLVSSVYEAASPDAASRSALPQEPTGDMK